MGDRERRKRKLRERKAKERQRQERRRVNAADARAQRLAEERRLIEEDRKILDERRPSEEEYEAKLAAARSMKAEDRVPFLESLEDDPERDFNLDDMLDFFALELEDKATDNALREALRDPSLHWFEQIDAVVRAGLPHEADLLRALVKAAEYPVTRQEQEEENARRDAARAANVALAAAYDTSGPSAADWVATLAPLSSGAGRFRRPRS